MTDLVTFGESMLRLSPQDRERLESVRELDVRVAGAESNVAVAAARLGLEVTWLSKLPDSPLGRRATRSLDSHGVETAVVWDDDRRMGTYYIEFGGQPRGTDVIYDRENAAVTTATPAQLRTDAVEAADIFHTTGITPALSGTLRETTADLLARAGSAGTTTSFDLNYRSKLWSPAEARETLEELLADVDILVVAERDAREVLDRSGDAEGIARDLDAAFDFEVTLVTRGERGSLALADGTVHEQPVFAADDYDPVGTGDAFVGGFLTTYHGSGDVARAMEYGAATASLKRTMPGDLAVVTPAEVEEVIERGDQSGISR